MMVVEATEEIPPERMVDCTFAVDCLIEHSHGFRSNHTDCERRHERHAKH